MRKLKLIGDNPKINFVGARRVAFLFSAVLLILSLATFATNGLNFGIDFRGGILIEVKTDGPADIAAMRADLQALQLGEVQIQQFGAPDDVLIRVQRQAGDEAEQLAAIATIQNIISDVVIDTRRTEFVGPTVGAELVKAAVLAVSMAIGAILIYIWFRFEWQFGVGAVIALIHDVVTTIGLFAITQLEFNLATVAAILTIAGYSINDTVVIYDRVREMLRRYKKLEIADLLNLAANSTLSRTVMTSLTTLLALVALATLGGSIIRDFALAMIWGVFVGTYSSVFIAVPALIFFELRPAARAAAPGEEPAEEPEGAEPAGA